MKTALAFFLAWNGWALFPIAMSAAITAFTHPKSASRAAFLFACNIFGCVLLFFIAWKLGGRWIFLFSSLGISLGINRAIGIAMQLRLIR